MKDVIKQTINWYPINRYAELKPGQSGSVMLALMNLKTEFGTIAEGQIWIDEQGDPQWAIDRLNGLPMAVIESNYNLKKSDFRLDYWADPIRYHSVLELAESSD
ncbi:MAG: hypothetical protein AAFP09_00935 [Cyanobacteria bacterium J06607_10]